MEISMGKRIKALRKYRGYTQEQLAEKLYIQAKLLSAYECDSVDIKSSVIKDMSETLNVKAGYFFGDFEIGCMDNDDIELDELISLYIGCDNISVREAIVSNARVLNALDKKL